VCAVVGVTGPTVDPAAIMAGLAKGEAAEFQVRCLV